MGLAMKEGGDRPFLPLRLKSLHALPTLALASILHNVGWALKPGCTLDGESLSDHLLERVADGKP